MRRSFWLWAGAGWLLMGVGAWGVLKDARFTRPAHLARWIFGSAIVHDVLLAPVVLLLGIAIARAVPAGWRRWVQAGLIVSGALAVVAFPMAVPFGRDPRNPSLLPGSYGVRLLVGLAAVWAVVGASVLYERGVRARR